LLHAARDTFDVHLKNREKITRKKSGNEMKKAEQNLEEADAVGAGALREQVEEAVGELDISQGT